MGVSVACGNSRHAEQENASLRRGDLGEAMILLLWSMQSRRLKKLLSLLTCLNVSACVVCVI